MNNPINEWLDEGMNVDIRLRPEGHPVTVVVEDPNDARVQWAGHGETLTHATSDAILDEQHKESSGAVPYPDYRPRDSVPHPDIEARENFNAGMP